jgi:uncharacterized phage-associated protein
MRTAKETLIDRLLMLYTVGRANQCGFMEGPFKLQKLPFAAQMRMNSQRQKGFSYTFFRYDHGPMSTEVYEDRDALQRSGMITGHQGPVRLTARGREVLSSAAPLFKKNRQIVSHIDWAASKYAGLSFGRLKDAIYGTKVKVRGKTVLIRDIPACVNVLTKLSEGEAQAEFRLSDDWLDSLWGIFDYSRDDWEKLKTVRYIRS